MTMCLVCKAEMTVEHVESKMLSNSQERIQTELRCPRCGKMATHVVKRTHDLVTITWHKDRGD